MVDKTLTALPFELAEKPGPLIVRVTHPDGTRYDISIKTTIVNVFDLEQRSDDGMPVFKVDLSFTLQERKVG